MFVEIVLEDTYPVLPKWGESQVRIYNGRDCNYNIGLANGIPNFELKSGEFHLETISVPSDTLPFTITGSATSGACTGITQSGVLESGKANSFFLERNSVIPFEDSPEKSRQGRPAIRVLTNFQSGRRIELIGKEQTYNFTSLERHDVLSGDYSISVGGVNVRSGFTLKLGGVYTFVINEQSTNVFVS